MQRTSVDDAMTEAERRDAQRMPTAAFWLGAAGALPFVGLAIVAAIFGPSVGPLPIVGALPVSPIDALRFYGAVILSFMGGVHWGLALAKAADGATAWRRYGVSVVPALWAWLALFAAPALGLFLLAVGFAALLAYDLAAIRRGEAAAWYATLRWPLTVTVVSCLLLAAFA